MICIAERTLHNVTFAENMNAGVFTALSESHDMASCVRKACNRRAGDVAMLLQTNCYMVSCYTESSCKITKSDSPSSISISVAKYTWFGKCGNSLILSFKAQNSFVFT